MIQKYVKRTLFNVLIAWPRRLNQLSLGFFENREMNFQPFQCCKNRKEVAKCDPETGECTLNCSKTLLCPKSFCFAAIRLGCSKNLSSFVQHMPATIQSSPIGCSIARLNCHCFSQSESFKSLLLNLGTSWTRLHDVKSKKFAKKLRISPEGLLEVPAYSTCVEQQASVVVSHDFKYLLWDYRGPDFCLVFLCWFVFR